MFRVDTSTADAVLPAQNAQGTPGYFTQGNPGTGTPATVPGQDWFNIIQEELMNVLTQAGIAPAKATTTQLYAAILKIIQANAAAYIKNNYAGSGAPIAGNDSTQGYSVGSLWYDNTDHNIYLCTNSTAGAAIWKDATLTLGDLGSIATQNANNVAISGGSITGLTALATSKVTADDGAGGIVINYSPTSGAGMKIQNNGAGIGGFIGAIYSTAAPVLCFNAIPTYGADMWTQTLNTLPSSLITVDNIALRFYTAIAGKAAGNFASFWGTPILTQTLAGNLTVSGTVQPGSARWRKRDIVDFKPSLQELRRLTLRSFNWDHGAHDFGSVGDEVYAVYPELTSPIINDSQHEGEPAHVNYAVLGYICGRRSLDFIAELQEQVANEKSRNNELAARIATLESKIGAK